ncbi:MAG TPA: hypothetical protein VMH22_12085 [bacterium]|nr:hypothetical protein [bacterium]
MKAYAFSAKVTPEGQVELPERLRRLLAADKTARLLVLMPETPDADELAAWDELTSEQFLAGYAAADAVYDQH